MRSFAAARSGRAAVIRSLRKREPWLPAEDEDVERRAALLRRQGVEFLADGIAEDDALALEVRQGRGEGHDGLAHGPPEQRGW